MKKELNLIKLLVSVMILGFAFTSCSDDDDDPKVEPKLEWIAGEYKGKMVATTAAKATAAPGVDITATAKDNKLTFADFPIKDIVVSVVGEEAAPAIIAAVGKVKYEIDYKAAFTEKKDGATLTFSPKSLELTVPISATASMAIKVTVSATEKGTYNFSTKDLKFNIKAESVTVDKTAFPTFKATTFNFTLNNTKQAK